MTDPRSRASGLPGIQGVAGWDVTRERFLRHRRDVGGLLSLEDCYRKWSDDLTRYATALVGPADAADLVGEAFAALLARGEAHWTTVREPRGYLYRTVLNASRTAARGRTRRQRREMRWFDGPVDGELLVQPEIRAALGRLTAQQRAMAFLTYWEDMSPAQVGAVLQVSEGTVKRQLARARTRLRQALS